MEEPQGILDLPLEDIVAIIERLDYKDLMDLCKSSSEFRELCRNPLIRKIRESKVPDVVGQIIRQRTRAPHLVGITIPYRSVSPDPNRELGISMGTYTNEIREITDITNRLSRGESFRDLPLGGGLLSTTPLGPLLIWKTADDTHMVVGLDRLVFTRLLEEWVEMVSNDTYGILTIFSDGTVSKRSL